jgi:sigma54-dependent transcription regulator
LFGVSRTRRSVTNRLKKYLARFGLDWAALQGQGHN